MPKLHSASSTRGPLRETSTPALKAVEDQFWQPEYYRPDQGVEDGVYRDEEPPSQRRWRQFRTAPQW